MSPSLRCLPESSLFPSLSPHPQPCCWSALANPCCRLEKSAQAADAKRKKEKEKRCSFACSLTYICMFTDPAGARPSLVGGDFSCRAHALLQPPSPAARNPHCWRILGGGRPRARGRGFPPSTTQICAGQSCCVSYPPRGFPLSHLFTRKDETCL